MYIRIDVFHAGDTDLPVAYRPDHQITMTILKLMEQKCVSRLN